MNENRISNTLRNTIFGFLNKLINILIPFLTRTVIIYVLGLEYAGLNSLFSSVLQVLNLAELGISTAIVYCMYKPMAENDKELICSLLKYMRKLYYIIGIIVSILGIIIIPFLPYFIKGSIPHELNIVILYSIYLLNTGIDYFSFAYKSTLLIAGQKVGVICNINSIIILCQGIAQIFGVVVMKNYYCYLAIMPIFTIINNIFISWATKKYYPDLICGGNLPENVKKDVAMRVKGLFVTRICTTTRNAFDSIFISAFIGLSAVAVYGNYYYIMSAVIGILNVLTVAMTASVGNSLVTESIEKNYRDFRLVNFVFNWIVGLCTCCLLTMIQPFMKIWMGENNLFPFAMVVLICIYFYMLNLGSIRAVYHDAAGLWWEARYRAVFEAVLNLVLNFFLTRWLGMFGTVLGTLIALIFVNYIWGGQIVFKYYFKEISVKQYFIDNFKYSIVTLVGCTISYFITTKIKTNGISICILAGIISIVVFNVIYYMCFCKTKIYAQSKKKFITIFDNCKRMLR